MIVSTDELGAGTTLCAWTRTFNARTPLDGLRVTPFCFSRRNRSLRTEAGLEPCPSPAPSPAPFLPQALRIRNPCRTRAEASRAQGGLVLFVLLSFIQGPGNQVFRIGAGGTRGEGRLRALSALGGARRPALPGSWESLGPRGILAGWRGEGERAIPRFFSRTVGRITCKNFSRPSPCPTPEEGGRHVKLITSCLLLLRGWRRGAGGPEAVFFSGGLFLSVSKSGRFFEVFLLNTCHRGLQLGKKITFLKHRKFIRTKVFSTKM